MISQAVVSLEVVWHISFIREKYFKLASWSFKPVKWGVRQQTIVFLFGKDMSDKVTIWVGQRRIVFRQTLCWWKFQMCLWVLLQVLSFFFQHLPVIIDFLNCIVLKVLNLFILLLEKFCNLIGLKQWYFSSIWNTCVWKITNLLQVAV